MSATREEIALKPGCALLSGHGQIAKYIGPATRDPRDVIIAHRSWRESVPAAIVGVGAYWRPVAGRVVLRERSTGRWVSGVETYLAITSEPE